MTIPTSVSATAIFFFLTFSALAQQPAPPPVVTAPVPRTIVGKVKQEPCWEEAGVSRATLEQRRSLEQGLRSQVSAVCADSSLTTQQRNEKIREIHQQVHQQIEALITPQQQEAMRACQQSREHVGGGGVHVRHAGGGMGPCGEALEPKPAPTPQPSPPQP